MCFGYFGEDKEFIINRSTYIHINIRNNILIKLTIHNRLVADSNLCYHVSKADALAAGLPIEFFECGKSGH